MKTMNKLLTGFVMLTLIMGMAFAGSAFAAGNEVKLIKSTLYLGSFGSVGFSGDIEVENISPTKTVTVHYTTDNTNWYSTNASYVGPTSGSYEQWNFTVSTSWLNNIHPELDGLSFIKFYIEYNVSGSTYYDNNGGSDYYNEPFISGPGSTILSARNVLSSFGEVLSSTNFRGSVLVKNLAPTKTVKILYTTNNWATTQTGFASYTGAANNFGSAEHWNYSFTVPSGSTVKFKIEYTVSGSTYVDDNYGATYTAT
ncbi:CBM21 domain-containing protein [Paenibacillus oenotherae]|uniref:CBM21 domain-containing protein n=1 Tax=Paenibacillus oenotherae TaxID=1435645 RepID=A0ABS7D6A1_9BACL|nr:CBM21 domain-containing protein [Paenibacillus oenotherae]MBW7475361.1 CBM21 domain-containing protein [Paenibacillus oenotherae]